MIRLIGAVLAEQRDEWVDSWRYMDPSESEVVPERLSSGPVPNGDREEDTLEEAA